jgi:uncharacterized protein involved in exopolysaccharide biosynthesis
MDFWDSVRILVRRWYVVVVVVVFTAVGAGALATRIPPSFRAQSQILLVPPVSASVPQNPNQPSANSGSRSNPYLSFDQSLATTADVLAKVMMSRETVERLRQQGATADYDVGFGAQGPGPVLRVLVTGKTEQEALDTLDKVAGEISQELQRRQQQVNAPQETWIQVSVIQQAQQADRLWGRVIRAVAGVAAVGIMFAIICAFIVENIANRRLRRPAPRPPIERPSPPATPEAVREVHAMSRRI